MPKVASLSQLADYELNDYWQDGRGDPHHFANSVITYNLDGLATAAEKNLAALALQAWQDICAVSFVPTSSGAQIIFSDSGSDSSAETDLRYSGSSYSGATITITTGWIAANGSDKDSYSFQTYLHEIGHALGLGHPGPYNATATYLPQYGTDNVFANDTWQYSIMSYFDQSNYGDASGRHVMTPQLADIVAADLIYGVAAHTREGDTVYGFNCTAGQIYDFGSYSTAPALTIFDSGGTDTLDCSGYGQAQRVDLRAGSFSSVDGETDNISIALLTNIENAVGGNGRDNIRGNEQGNRLEGSLGNDTLVGAEGNDVLIGGPAFGGPDADILAGGKGRDTLTGGADRDIFDFNNKNETGASSSSRDVITDFHRGNNTTGDEIDLRDVDANGKKAGNQAFAWIGAQAFDQKAGELHYKHSGADVIVEGDVDGNGSADFQILVQHLTKLGSGDFIL